jgi:hypothetical protein
MARFTATDEIRGETPPLQTLRLALAGGGRLCGNPTTRHSMRDPANAESEPILAFSFPAFLSSAFGTRERRRGTEPEADRPRRGAGQGWPVGRPPPQASTAGDRDSGGEPGPPFFGYFLWRRKESNSPCGRDKPALNNLRAKRNNPHPARQASRAEARSYKQTTRPKNEKGPSDEFPLAPLAPRASTLVSALISPAPQTPRRGSRRPSCRCRSP